MGTMVLQPHHWLRKSPSQKPVHSPSPPPKMKLKPLNPYSNPNPNPKPNPKPARTHTHNNRPKRISSTAHPSFCDPQPHVKKLVMGQVKILKRGEPLTETVPDPQTETVREVVGLTEGIGVLFAGSATLVSSPPPSSVPVPFFLTKKVEAGTDLSSGLYKNLDYEFS